MNFRKDVKATPHLDGALREGLGAMHRADRDHVTVDDPNSLLGSVNVDAALQASQPHAARWDYVVGQKKNNKQFLHWIEVHPAASPGNINEVAAKLDWLVTWMKDTRLADYPRQFVWIASGKCAFNQRYSGLRDLASRGLRFVGGNLKLKP
jgi:hypothetical protein